MVAITSFLGRYAVLISIVALGKSNYVIADGSSLKEHSSAAWADTHRQLAVCCYNSNGCHPNPKCNLDEGDCLNSKGKLRCNSDNSYQWGNYGSPPPPAPTNAPIPPPTNPPAPTNPPTPQPVSSKDAGTVICYLYLWSLILCHDSARSYYLLLRYSFALTSYFVLLYVFLNTDIRSCGSYTSSNQSSRFSLLRPLCRRYFNILYHQHRLSSRAISRNLYFSR